MFLVCKIFYPKIWSCNFFWQISSLGSLSVPILHSFYIVQITCNLKVQNGKKTLQFWCGQAPLTKMSAFPVTVGTDDLSYLSDFFLDYYYVIVIVISFYWSQCTWLLTLLMPKAEALPENSSYIWVFSIFHLLFSSLSYIFDTLNTINETANLAILYQTDHSDSARKVSWIRIFERTNQQFNFAESSKTFLTIWKWKALNALSTKQFLTNHCSFALFWMINDQYCSWPIIVGFL